MKYRRLGHSDIEVSEIALGSWLTYGGGVDRATAGDCVHRALDLGINFIDTANVYGRGAAETVLGEILSQVPRERYVLATKLYFPMSDSDRGLSRAQVFKQIDASLQRLQTDYVDLYQCHRYDEDTPLEETMEALTRVVREGKARAIGFSEWLPDEIRAVLALPEAERFVSSQPQYSMIWRAPEEAVMPLCAANGISQIVWSPLAQGVLTGKYPPDQPRPRDSRWNHGHMNAFMDRFDDPPLLAAVQDLVPIAADLGLSMAQLALAWVLRQANVASAIVGASRPGQLEDNAGASGVVLDASTLAAIDEHLAPVLGRHSGTG